MQEDMGIINLFIISIQFLSIIILCFLYNLEF